MSWDLPEPGVHVGTASWSSEDWKGPFYPNDLAPREFLPYYAERFDTVEVDSTFYRSPGLQLTRKWKRDTPGTFRFALKVPRTITHEKALKDCRREFDRFADALAELGDRVGFVLFQFGYFNKRSACPTLDAFLERLDAFLKDVRVPGRTVVEIRNARWLGGELLEFLRERGVVLALAEQQWMLRISKLWEIHGEGLLTGPAAYVRFLGERKRIEAIADDWSRVRIDRSDVIREWIPVLREFRRRGVDVWTYFNNHFAGFAPGSIELFRRLWRESA